MMPLRPKENNAHLVVSLVMICAGVIFWGSGIAQAYEKDGFAAQIVKLFKNKKEEQKISDRHAGFGYEFRQFKGFVFHRKEGKKVDALFLVDIVLDCEKSEAPGEVDDVQLRKIIYRVSKNVISERGLSPNMQKHLKKEISIGVNQWMKRPFVRSVFVTGFMKL